MSLIPSNRHRPGDLDLWDDYAAADLVNGQGTAAGRRVRQSLDVIRAFTRNDPAYASVSWGKDSTVLAHLVRIASPSTPLVWIHVTPIANPDCVRVRDGFLAAFPGPYVEITVPCVHDQDGWHASGTLERGFSEAEASFGPRYINGVRADEAGYRKRMMRSLGLYGDRTCRPLGWWTAKEIYGYLAVHDLPIHPAYAMLGGGRWPREHLRVSSLGGRRGDGFGRRDWELEYYGDVLRRLDAARA